MSKSNRSNRDLPCSGERAGREESTRGLPLFLACVLIYRHWHYILACAAPVTTSDQNGENYPGMCCARHESPTYIHAPLRTQFAAPGSLCHNTLLPPRIETTYVWEGWDILFLWVSCFLVRYSIISPEFHQNFTRISPEVHQNFSRIHRNFTTRICQKIELEHLEKGENHISAFLHTYRRKGSRMANLRTKILDFRRFDSSIISNVRGGILMSTGNSPESLSQGILGIILGRWGVDYRGASLGRRSAGPAPAPGLIAAAASANARSR